MKTALTAALLAAAVPLAAQNQCLTLTTGVDGGVEYTNDARMVPVSGITVEAWIQYDDTTIPTGLYYWPTIARQNVSPQMEAWNFRVNAGNAASRNLAFIVRATNNQLYTAAYTFASGEFANWTHVAGTFDGDWIRIFKDGVEVASYQLPLTSAIFDQGGTMRVGNGDPVAPGNEAWNGSIDELRIWPMARSAGEIAASMNDEFYLHPPSLLVLPFDGNYDTRDQTLTGVPFGTVGFNAGNTVTLPAAPALQAVGQGSSSCARVPELLAGSPAYVGNSAFTLWCVKGPLPAASPVGAVFASAGSLPGVPALGINVYADPNTLVASFAQAPPTDALGNARFALPIPNQANLSGATWTWQYVFLDSTCGPQGFTASNGLTMSVQ